MTFVATKTIFDPSKIIFKAFQQTENASQMPFVEYLALYFS
jgi:hypothetical protein